MIGSPFRDAAIDRGEVTSWVIFDRASGLCRAATSAFPRKLTSGPDVKLVAIGRVEMWRGGCRLNISVAASFDWRCLSGSTMAPFPHPAHRTGQADFPHPALGQDFTPLLSRATPSAVSEHSSELIGCPISMSFTTYCVCLELRSLPSTGITRPHWYYEPLRHPRAPGLSLAGVRLVIADRA